MSLCSAVDGPVGVTSLTSAALSRLLAAAPQIPFARVRAAIPEEFHGGDLLHSVGFARPVCVESIVGGGAMGGGGMQKQQSQQQRGRLAQSTSTVSRAPGADGAAAVSTAPPPLSRQPSSPPSPRQRHKIEMKLLSTASGGDEAVASPAADAPISRPLGGAGGGSIRGPLASSYSSRLLPALPAPERSRSVNYGAQRSSQQRGSSFRYGRRDSGGAAARLLGGGGSLREEKAPPSPEANLSPAAEGERAAGGNNSGRPWGGGGTRASAPLMSVRSRFSTERRSTPAAAGGSSARSTSGNDSDAVVEAGALAPQGAVSGGKKESGIPRSGEAALLELSDTEWLVRDSCRHLRLCSCVCATQLRCSAARGRYINCSPSLTSMRQVGTALVFAFIYHGRLMPYRQIAERQKKTAELFYHVTSAVGHHGARQLLL